MEKREYEKKKKERRLSQELLTHLEKSSGGVNIEKWVKREREREKRSSPEGEGPEEEPGRLETLWQRGDWGGGGGGGGGGNGMEEEEEEKEEENRGMRKRG